VMLVVAVAACSTNGSGAPDETVVVLATDQGSIGGLAVDASGVYWTIRGDEVGIGDGAIASVTPTGGSAATLAPNQNYPGAIALAAPTAYWVNATTIVREAEAGGSASVMATDINNLLGIAVDSTNVYWTTAGEGSDGAVSMAPLGGGSAVALASGLHEPGPIVARAGALFWIDRADKVIYELAAGSSTVQAIAPDQSTPIAIAVDDNRVYWSNSDGSIASVPIGGGPAATLATGGMSPSGLASDGASVYWADGVAGTISSVPVTGGHVSVLASAQLSPGFVVVDETSVYWAADSTIAKIAK
jgi:hypothetical protein